MKLVVDINHPAHVHFFKNFIWMMEKKDNEVLVISSEKDIACRLLDRYGFDYINLGSYGKSMIKKMLNIPRLDYKMYYSVKNFNPDILIGLASVRAAHASFFLRKKCIIFDDTENGRAELRLYLPFAHSICTPSCYFNELGKKQIRYNGYHELAYLHPNYYTPDPSISDILGVKSNEKYIIMRFVSWRAVHDMGHTGLSLDTKKKAVREFSKYAKVFISSEWQMPEDLEKYRIIIPLEKIHDALYFATLFYGESSTMASESAVLGTPAIFLDNVGRGYTFEQEKIYGSVFNFTESLEDQKKSIMKGLEILKTPDVKGIWREKRKKLLKDKIDVTSWMINFIEEKMRS